MWLCECGKDRNMLFRKRNWLTWICSEKWDSIKGQILFLHFCFVVVFLPLDSLLVPFDFLRCLPVFFSNFCILPPFSQLSRLCCLSSLFTFFSACFHLSPRLFLCGCPGDNLESAGNWPNCSQHGVPFQPLCHWLWSAWWSGSDRCCLQSTHTLPCWHTHWWPAFSRLQISPSDVTCNTMRWATWERQEAEGGRLSGVDFFCHHGNK